MNSLGTALLGYRRVGLTSKREIVVRKNTCKAFAEVLSNILACFNKKPFLSAICHDFGSPGSKASLPGKAQALLIVFGYICSFRLLLEEEKH